MITRALILTALVFASGCTTFSHVRPARIEPGISTTLTIAAAANPGDDAAWFWAFDCAIDCGRHIVAAELAFYKGFEPSAGRPGFEIGAGLNGAFYPFAQGYVQLSKADQRAWGLGARLGVPARNTWHEHQLFGRFEVSRSAKSQLILQPALFLHSGNSPNGANPGTFVAIIPAIGRHSRGAHLSGTITLAPVLGWTRRESGISNINWSPTVFATIAAGLTWHRRS